MIHIFSSNIEIIPEISRVTQMSAQETVANWIRTIELKITSPMLFQFSHLLY